MRALVFSGLALAAACASAAEEAPTPLWRTDGTHLAQDAEAARACLRRDFGALDRCVFVIQEQCPGWRAGEGWHAGGARRCDWRAIAAWEDVMSGVLSELSELHDAGAVAGAQEAWERSVLADVRLAASAFEDGSWEGARAAGARAEAVARRAIWLERERRRVREGAL